MIALQDIHNFDSLKTPFYYYDMSLLKDTAESMKRASEKYSIDIHYAMKANSEKRILEVMRMAGFGVDCVSGAEVRMAISSGFPANRIFYAGVGKTDEEMKESLEAGIECFNVESVEELEVLADIAEACGKRAPVALRVNPNIDARTMEGITTGLEENKFGIADCRIDEAIALLKKRNSLAFRGLHFHVGSQIMELEDVYEGFCKKVSGAVDKFENAGLKVETLDLGGGLGIDYEHPDLNPIPDFDRWMRVIDGFLDCRKGRRICLEPGRSLVGQCGSLVCRVLFVKKSVDKEFLILDAGFNNLLRPALYGAYHRIDNLNAELMGCPSDCVYDVVGPICESTDVFAKARTMPRCLRGDFIAIRSAGAYGSVMASNYNMQGIAPAVFNDGE